MAVYTLPDLDYDYGALAPHISGEIMPHATRKRDSDARH